MRTVTTRALVVLGLGVGLFGGCGGEETQSTSEPAPIEPAKDAIAKTTENGPVKATVRVWPAKPTLGESIYVRLEIEAPAGISIDAPFQEAGDQRLGRFRVVGFTRDTERQPSGGQLQQQTYTLEAPSSGRQRIPPLRLEMIDARAQGAAGSADTRKPQGSSPTRYHSRSPPCLRSARPPSSSPRWANSPPMSAARAGPWWPGSPVRS